MVKGSDNTYKSELDMRGFFTGEGEVRCVASS